MKRISLDFIFCPEGSVFHCGQTLLLEAPVVQVEPDAIFDLFAFVLRIGCLQETTKSFPFFYHVN